jgi:curved DNA binding protein
VCHWCSSEADATTVSAGDWVKVDLAVHIDGYIAAVAHTVICPAADGAAPAPVDGKQGDVLAAAACARELLPHLVRPGLKNTAIPGALAAVAAAFGVSVVEGVLMHQMKRFVLDGNQVVAACAGPELRAAEFEFGVGEVYTLDVVFSTGEGKPKMVDEKQTAVYKHALGNKYNLKLKAARAVMGDIISRLGMLAFAERAVRVDGPDGGPTRVKLGLTECLKNDLLHSYPVLWEKPGDCVAHFKATVLLMPNGPDVVTGAAAAVPAHVSDKRLTDDDLLATLAQPLRVSKKAAKKAAKAETAAAPQ